MAAPIFQTVQLIAKQTVARQIVILRFTKPVGFSFAPGQFVQVRVPEGEKFVLRSYSLSSIPNDNYLELCVKILPGGKASALFAGLPVGGEVAISAARGFFVVKPEHAKQKIFIATGAGIAPVMSMIRGSLATNDQAALLLGVRSEEDLFWVERLEAVKQSRPRFEFVITLTQPGSSWVGKQGRVTAHLPISARGEYYICGSADMVEDVRRILLVQGMNTKSIHIEIF